MSLITRQGKGSKLTIEEMDNNLLYLESLSGTSSTSIIPPSGITSSFIGGFKRISILYT